LRRRPAGRRRRSLTFLGSLLGEIRRARRARLSSLALLLPLDLLLPLFLLAHLIRPTLLLLAPLLLHPLALILAHAGMEALVDGPALFHHAPDLIHEGLAGDRIARASHLAA
jgi:hypothetical protein